MQSTPITFRDLIAANQRNSIGLVVLFCVGTVAIALVLGLGIIGLGDSAALSRLSWAEGLLVGGIAAGVALGIALLGYYRGDQMILSASHARPVAHEDDPELFNVVEEMAIAAGAPLPRLYLIEDSAPNAFATGRDPQHASIAITSGLRAKLTRDELQGVIAHEMSHIRNYDIRLMLLLAVLVGTIAILVDVFWQALRFTSFGGSRRRRSDNDSGGNAFGLVLLVLAVVLGLVAPFLAQIMQLAVSRQREYLADASAVELTRYPLGLASALRKIDADPEVLEVANRGTAHLYIANPIKGFEARAQSMLSSHPPIQDRIARLEVLSR